MASTSKKYGGRLVCKYHPDANLIEDCRAGDMICPECGLVVGDRIIDVSSEWRTFSDKTDSDPCRVGAAENPFLNGNDLSTIIGAGTGNASFNELGVPKYKNKRMVNSSDQALINGFKEISNMADRISLPKAIVDRAKGLFKQIRERNTVKGRSTESIAASCVYIACRQEGVPRTFKEICAICKVSKKDIGRCFKLILKALETSVDLITTGDFMSRFCSNLELPNVVQRAATFIAKQADDLGIVTGRSYVSVAAASIYLACLASENKKSPKEIGDVAGVAEVTIKQLYKDMCPRAYELFPHNFKFFTPIDEFPQA